jgi:hypothetical protein
LNLLYILWGFLFSFDVALGSDDLQWFFTTIRFNFIFLEITCCHKGEVEGEILVMWLVVLDLTF